jgi:hypothetical protein
LSPIDKSTPNRFLGGEKDFDTLISTSNEVGIKIVVDCTTRLSARLAHRKYRDLVIYVLDDEENLKILPGTDGRQFIWNDSVQLNFRFFFCF